MMSGGFLGAGVEQSVGIGAPLYGSSNLGPVELLPNPDFVFPARPHTVSLEHAGWKWPTKRPHSHQNLPESSGAPASLPRASLSILPGFSFNPAGSSQVSPIETPPHSPDVADPSTPSRSTRHRRGGSEFIGGDATIGNGNAGTRSPSKAGLDEAGQPSRLRPPAGRRHTHRRSGAISCHDLATILQPRDINTRLRSGSAPTSPLGSTENKPFFPSRPSQSLDHDPTVETGDEISDGETTPQCRPPSRARVGFADRVEYIRPLSTISSETESSMSTIRGHSLSNSLSSVHSASTTSPSGTRMSCPSLDTTYEDENVSQRPDSAGTEHGDLNAGPLELKPSSPKTTTVGHDSDIGSWSGFTAGSSNDLRYDQVFNSPSLGWWDSRLLPLSTPQNADVISHRAPLLPLKPSLLSPESSNSLAGLHESDGETVVEVQNTVPPRQPRRVRSWAHSLISRKHKCNKDLTSPITPSTFCLSNDYRANNDQAEQSYNGDEFEINFDEDNTVTIINESAKPVTSPLDALLAHSACTPERDVRSPVIDLDTALAPLHPQINGHLARQFRDRKLMHSSSTTSMSHGAGRGHRRTESAPELVIFGPRTGKPTQPWVMPDVFEEEDEEFAEETISGRSTATDSSAGLTVKMPSEENLDIDVSAAGKDEMRSAPEHLPLVSGFGWARHKKSGLSIETGSHPSSTILDSPEGHLSLKSRSGIPVEVVDGDGAVIDKVSEDIITPPLTGDKSPMTTQAGFQYALSLASQQIMTPDTINDASMYSPLFNRSQVSFDTSRLNTAPPSIAESRSLKSGEPGPEICVSVDDIPSLISSQSTMASPAIYSMRPPQSSAGAGSVYSIHSTATVDSLHRKRASIVSLTRLISTSLGERNNLSTRSRRMSQDLMTESKRKRSQHRLSKLMFWKKKESRPVTRG